MAGGWTEAKVEAFREAFFEFLTFAKVNSKELGTIAIGDNLYQSQIRFFDGIFDGLVEDIHDFKIGKSRQLGISSGSRALTLFWIGVHDGLKGYMIFDTDDHKEEARLELIDMVDALPSKLKFPRIKYKNRYMLVLSNGSVIKFASAGVKRGKGSGVLGRSSGINFVHCSEMCSWDNVEGLEALRSSLAQDFENRLYIWESTARGYNQWFDMWNDAKADERHQKTIFIGWWAKDNQVIERDDPDFEIYGRKPPTEAEIKKIRLVKELYDWQITPEQLAWVRRNSDPSAKADGEADPDFEPTTLRLQENPWTEDDMFQMTGSKFFDAEALTEQAHKNASTKFKTYVYMTGTEFAETRIYPARNQREVQLKVWEEPEEDAVYVLCDDVAFGHDENNDRSAISVLRCYADGLDQVAEYAYPLVNTRQFAWVIASLMGWYGGQTSSIYHIMEINGPGEAAWNELRSLKFQIANSYTPKEIEEKGLRNVFRNVRDYMYTRSDSMTPGQAWQWKTTTQLKVAIMERLRDFTVNGMLRIRSLDTLEEMKKVAREGDSIAGEGNAKDDRVMALAMGVKMWEDRARKELIIRHRTREFELNKRRMTITDQVQMFNKSQLTQFFAAKKVVRNRERALALKAKWRR
jgi:hypothetical protein